MKRLLLLTLLIGLPSYAGDISASYSNSKFEEEFHVDTLQSIEMWEQPKTKYTPKNLRTEQQMRFNGKEGTRTYNSYTLHMTDYDTYVTDSYIKDNKFYIKDNTGKTFITGVDYGNEVQQATKAIQTNANNIKQVSSVVKTNANNIKQVSSVVKTNANNIKALGTNLQRLDQKVDRVIDGVYQLNDKVDKGLATVTALTSLHPNPRFKGKTQVAIGSGVYNNNVAGAVGIFHYVNDNVMVSIGASYGGSNSWAGNVGLSIGF